MANFITFNEYMDDPLKWQALVRYWADTYRTPKYSQFISPIYSESRKWKAVSAEIGRIPMASMIDRRSGKPQISAPKPLDMNGSMPTFGNEMTFSSDERNRIMEIQRGIMSGVVPPDGLIDYFGQYLQILALSPQFAIDKLFFEGISNGTATIDADNNLAGLEMSIDWDLNKTYCSTVWTDTTNADGIADLRTMYDTVEETYGIKMDQFLMSKTTFRALQAQSSVKERLSVELRKGNKTTKYDEAISRDVINNYLFDNYELPPIGIIDERVSYFGDDGVATSSTTSAFTDYRVTGTVGNNYGSLIWTPADEQTLPDPGVVYETINNVLISRRTERGSMSIESEFNGIPVPPQNDLINIMITDATSA